MTAAWTEITNPNVIIDKNDIVETFKKYAFNNELKEDAVGDQVTEIIFKKLIEQAHIAEQQQLPQKEQSPALPPQQTESDTGKTQKYVT